MSKFSKFNRLRFVGLALAFLATSLMYFIPEVSAAYLSNTSVVLTNMNAGGASNVVIQFTTPASTPGTAAGSLVFSGWTGSGGTGTVATPTVSTCSGIYASDTAIPGTLTPTATAASGTISWTDTTALATSTTYCFTLTGAVTANPTTPGQTVTTLTEGTSTATTQAIDVISNDQISVSAVVPPSFTMSLGSNSDPFLANLSSGTVGATTGVKVTVNTNAKSGWYLWGSDANNGLKSTTQNYTIPSKTPGTNATLTAGTEGYLSGIPTATINQGTGAGTTSAATAFASSGAGNGSGLNGTNALMASSNGTANNAYVYVNEYAAISSNTPAAADYADTVTLVGAGSF